ncbi:MAG: glutaminase A [Thiotrichales bacterium]
MTTNSSMSTLPLQQYLNELHANLQFEIDGEVASYIPELTRVDPEAFGIVLVTVDGAIYEVGQVDMTFTIQSISKAIVYGIALMDKGLEGVFEKVGVEPSGEAFNSISLESESGRPMNPMINAGAIATTGLVAGDTAKDRLNHILSEFEKYTGHPVEIDAEVYQSEKETGHRNRAISHLLRNADILSGDPEEVLDIYFKQCSINVTAKDLALMGACLANNGVNPKTGETALDPQYVEKVTSVMSTCGMYDYSGNWAFNVGLPAKSGVGGGIMAVLPGQFGLGVFSPRLDARGNSTRGIKVCTALSRDFGLHMLKATRGLSSSVIRVTYDATTVNSNRLRDTEETQILEQHGKNIRVYELQGQLIFSAADSIVRTLNEDLGSSPYLILDFKRVVDMDIASIKLLQQLCSVAARQNKKLFLSATQHLQPFRHHLAKFVDIDDMLKFVDLDHALEWCENSLIADLLHTDSESGETPLSKQYLLADFSDEEIRELENIGHQRTYSAGETIFKAGEKGESFFLVTSGLVSSEITTQEGKRLRLVSMSPGMSIGEFALVTNNPRSTNCTAIVDTTCIEVLFKDIEPDMKSRLLVNLARELARRLTKDARELAVIG